MAVSDCSVSSFGLRTSSKIYGNSTSNLLSCKSTSSRRLYASLRHFHRAEPATQQSGAARAFTTQRPLSARRYRGCVKPAASSKEVELFGGLRLSQKDVDILTLLVPALGSVFLDPAMQVIDTGDSSFCSQCIQCTVIWLNYLNQLL